MEVKEPKQYFKCRVVSKSMKKDGVPHVKVSYDGWGREYDECLRVDLDVVLYSHFTRLESIT